MGRFVTASEVKSVTAHEVINSTVTLDKAYTCHAGLIVGVENGDVVVDMTREEREEREDDSKSAEHEGS